MGVAVSEATPEAPGPVEVEVEVSAQATEVQVGPNGYPLDTKPADMTLDHRANYLQHQLRREQDHNKANSKRLKDLEPKAKQYDDLAAASRTEAERAADEARAAGEKAGREAASAEAREVYGAQLVEATLKAAARDKGLTPEALLKLAGKPSRFLDDNGMDHDAIGDFLSALPDKAIDSTDAPAAVRPAVRDIGGGVRTAPKVDAIVEASAAYAARHGKKSPAQSG